MWPVEILLLMAMSNMLLCLTSSLTSEISEHFAPSSKG
jgi:hypothetical protein